MDKNIEIEIMNQIYDTLMGNVGMSDYHVPFPINDIIYSWIEGNKIYFELLDKAFELEIKSVSMDRS